jgi:hypothetical protein
MWYSKASNTRAQSQVFLPSGRILTEADKGGSPIQEWSWHDTEPDWWIIANPPPEPIVEEP